MSFNKLRQSSLWVKGRELKILHRHRNVAKICKLLLRDYRASGSCGSMGTGKVPNDGKTIWQYWSDGFENAPDIVRQCIASVDKFKGEYRVIRLSDKDLDDYLSFPEFVKEKRNCFSVAFFSDLLRLALLSEYGGIWMDATVLLSGPVPEDITKSDFFMYRRDPDEPDKEYWSRTYAYYFGWAKGFRVNCLSSFLVAKKGCQTIKDLCGTMLLWWKEHRDCPDYFFLQILCDVYGFPADMPFHGDTKPHYLQQLENDPFFNLMSRKEILESIPIHKLTYKTENRHLQD